MEEFIYCQLDINNICVGVSQLLGEVSEYNYIDTPHFNPIDGTTTYTNDFVSRMIKVNVYSTNYIGLKYNNGSWESVPV